MKTLFTADYKDYEQNWPVWERQAARAIIVTGDGIDLRSGQTIMLKPDDKIALVYAKNLGYYKFPGGGINTDEDKISALIREVMEETGLEVIRKSVTECGVDHRTQASERFPGSIFKQDSYHYFCNVKTDSGGNLIVKKQFLEGYEKNDGFELKVVSIKEAVETNVYFKSENYMKLDMIARETLVMEKICGMQEQMPRCFAEWLLERGVAKNPGPWREHSIAVANAAEKIARAVNENAAKKNELPKLNPDIAYTYGLLHDIGRQEGYTYLAHVYDGYKFLLSLGYADAARICITHSFNLQTTDDYIGKRDVSDATFEEIKSLLAGSEFDDYDRLIQLLDSTCSADGTKDLERRMNDVKERYGYYPQDKWNKNFELKEYFENLAGRDFYEMI